MARFRLEVADVFRHFGETADPEHLGAHIGITVGRWRSLRTRRKLHGGLV
jgi:hypothetical protein